MTTIYTSPDRAAAYRQAAPDARVLEVDMADLLERVPAWARFQDGQLTAKGMTDHLATWGSRTLLDVA